jgi:hypothetical protein
MSAAEAAIPGHPPERPDTAAPSAGPFPTRSDKASLIIIGAALALLVLGIRGYGPSMSDTWYHLALADETLERGGVPLWDDWEFAPYGRPNLYPPVLHILLAATAAVTGGVLNAGAVFAAVFMPLGMLTTWLAARKLLNDRMAFLALVFMLLDMAHLVIMNAYIASCLVNILMPLLLVAILRRRSWLAIAMLTVLYYSHLGFPHVVSLGLLLFGVVERTYLRLALKVVGISFLFWTPWLAHVARHWEWVSHVFSGGGMPGPLIFKLLALQFINLLVVVCGIIGARKLWKRGGFYRIIPCMMVGFLPILLSYGGRYLMHTLPLWAMAGAFAVQGILPPDATRLRHVLLVAFTLLPAPTVVFGDKPSPMPFTSSHMLVIMPFSNGGLGDEDRNEKYGPDCEQLADWLRTHTTPDEVIHTNKEWVADAIALLADRPTDFGAWWECGNERWKRYNRAWRDGRESSVFVALKPRYDAGSIFNETPPMPGMDETIEIGRFQVGIRHRHEFRANETPIPLTDMKPVRVDGAAGGVKLTWPESPMSIVERARVMASLDEHPSKEGFDPRLRWAIPRDSGARLAAIEMPVPTGDFEGVEVRIRSDRVDPVTLGLRLEGGGEERFEIVFPMEGEWRLIRIPRAWMESDREGEGLPPVEAVYLSWAAEEPLPPRTLEVHHVHLLHEE